MYIYIYIFLDIKYIGFLYTYLSTDQTVKNIFPIDKCKCTKLRE